MQRKLASWKSNNISLAGRITLCKSALSTIPLYPMQSTILPKGICMEIEKICRRFIWGMKEGRGKTHLLNWRTLCRPKVEGGLGLRRMQDMNKAFTMKLTWGILNNNSSLWVEFLKAKYAKTQTQITEVQATSRDSSLWKAICKIWPQVRFWTDNWLDGFGPLINHSIQEVPVNMINLTVADMANDGKHRCWDKFARTLPLQLVMILAGCPPPA